MDLLLASQTFKRGDIGRAKDYAFPWARPR